MVNNCCTNFEGNRSFDFDMMNNGFGNSKTHGTFNSHVNEDEKRLPYDVGKYNKRLQRESESRLQCVMLLCSINNLHNIQILALTEMKTCYFLWLN